MIRPADIRRCALFASRRWRVRVPLAPLTDDSVRPTRTPPLDSNFLLGDWQEIAFRTAGERKRLSAPSASSPHPAPEVRPLGSCLGVPLPVLPDRHRPLDPGPAGPSGSPR